MTVRGPRGSRLRRAAFVVVVVFVATLPWGNTSVGPVELVQAMAALGVLAVLAADAIELDPEVPPWQVGLPLVAMGVSAALATVGTPVPDTTFRINASLAVGALLVVAMWSIVDRTGRLLVLAEVLVVAGAAVGVVALWSSSELSVVADGAIVTGRIVGTFSQPNELGVFSALLLPIAVSQILALRGVRQLVAGAAALAIAAALLLSLSRGAWLGGLAGIVVLVCLAPGRRRAVALVTSAVVAGALFILLAPPATVEVIGQRVASLTSDSVNPYDERDEIYAEAGRQIADSPLVGHGPGAFPTVARGLTPDGYDLDAEHAHSLVLVVATEYGMIGVASLLALVAGVVWLLHRRVWRRLEHAGGEGRELAIVTTGLFAGLVAVVAHGVIDYPLRNPVSGTTVWLVLALLVAATRCASTLSVGVSRDVSP